jgi:hypothetical protein
MALFDQITGRTRIKICGLTQPEQVDLAQQLAIANPDTYRFVLQSLEHLPSLQQKTFGQSNYTLL